MVAGCAVRWGVHFHPLSLLSGASVPGSKTRALVRKQPQASSARPWATGVRVSLILHALALAGLWLAAQGFGPPRVPALLEAAEVSLRLPSPRSRAPKSLSAPGPLLAPRVLGTGPSFEAPFPEAIEQLPLELTVDRLPSPVAALEAPLKREQGQWDLVPEPDETAEETDEGEAAQLPVEPEPSAASVSAASTAKPARPLAPLQPSYPRRCQRRACQGSVSLELELHAEGHVISAEVVSSSGCASLDAAALEAALKARFAPDAPSPAPVVVHFRLR